jgi:hypothetical protein
VVVQELTMGGRNPGADGGGGQEAKSELSGG